MASKITLNSWRGGGGEARGSLSDDRFWKSALRAERWQKNGSVNANVKGPERWTVIKDEVGGWWLSVQGSRYFLISSLCCCLDLVSKIGPFFSQLARVAYIWCGEFWTHENLGPTSGLRVRYLSLCCCLDYLVSKIGPFVSQLAMVAHEFGPYENFFGKMNGEIDQRAENITNGRISDTLTKPAAWCNRLSDQNIKIFKVRIKVQGCHYVTRRNMNTLMVESIAGTKCREYFLATFATLSTLFRRFCLLRVIKYPRILKARFLATSNTRDIFYSRLFDFQLEKSSSFVFSRPNRH